MSAVLGGIVAASPANAAITVNTNTDCDAQCIVLYFNTGYAGSHTVIHSDTPDSGEGIYNLEGYTFLSSGNGKGQGLKNNAASAKARIWGINSSVTVYYNSGYSGPCDKFAKVEGPAAYQLKNTYNENASVFFRNKTVNQNCADFG
ncbi:peptidase inhibitor family I36 protein [Kitasatospora sp. DSM 101779]|uniref:peptidase inhibitor family I36 protein n=1 Tax=Kitasatospora sp. DSM 101779 TaxID=2853165 RepID=UPI0021D81077|nr:peptidase inhibitor family I36 protein [Kitasatospora sp. DSM 101779]